MRIVVQRVASASVDVGSERVGAIGKGLLALVGVGVDDTVDEARGLADKTARLRIFDGLDGGPERAVGDIGGAVLVVSQFTLMGDTRRGNRPSWSAAARPEIAEPIVVAYVGALEGHGLPVVTGRFGAHMAVALVNDGPLTLVLDSRA